MWALTWGVIRPAGSGSAGAAPRARAQSPSKVEPATITSNSADWTFPARSNFTRAPRRYEHAG
eukprot:2237336-Rhodomonas_salina.3